MRAARLWAAIAQLARLIAEYAERQVLEERPIVDVIKEAWGSSQRKRV